MCYCLGVAFALVQSISAGYIKLMCDKPCGCFYIDTLVSPSSLVKIDFFGVCLSREKQGHFFISYLDCQNITIVKIFMCDSKTSIPHCNINS